MKTSVWCNVRVKKFDIGITIGIGIETGRDQVLTWNPVYLLRYDRI